MSQPAGPVGADPVAVGLALRGWLADRFGAGVALAEPPAAVSGGLDSWVHLVRFTGDVLPAPWSAPLVARVAPAAERAEQSRREAEVQRWCAERGFPTPQVLAVLDPGEALDVPVQVMARAPGTTMADAMARRPWTALALVDRLAGLHVRLHRLDPGGVEAGGTAGGPPETGPVVDRRLRLPRAVARRLGHAGLAAALEAVERTLPLLQAAPPSLCHGDLHPRNVLVDGPADHVIDWSDAGTGDRHCDVARAALLFGVAAASAAGTAERTVLRAAAPVLARRFLRTYRSQLPLDPERLALWEPVHLVHLWSQVLAAEAGLLAGPASVGAGTPDLPPVLGAWCEDRLRR